MCHLTGFDTRPSDYKEGEGIWHSFRIFSFKASDLSKDVVVLQLSPLVWQRSSEKTALKCMQPRNKYETSKTTTTHNRVYRILKCHYPGWVSFKFNTFFRVSYISFVVSDLSSFRPPYFSGILFFFLVFRANNSRNTVYIWRKLPPERLILLSAETMVPSLKFVSITCRPLCGTSDLILLTGSELPVHS